MKLTYWVCANREDVPAYNIRETTRRAANARREEYGAECYSKPYKVEVNYDDGFDLLRHCFEHGASGVEVNRSEPK